MNIDDDYTSDSVKSKPSVFKFYTTKLLNLTELL